MTRLHLRYIDRFRDRHGRVRYYFRRGKAARIPLPGLPGSDAFMGAYQSALAEVQSTPRPTNRASRGSFNHLAIEYFSSPDFLRLRPQTRHVYRLVIERFLQEHGHRLVREMIRDDVKRIIASKANTPGAANDLLKKIRVLINFAIESGIRTDDPTLRIKTFPEGEIHTWTEEEIAQFEARWPKGTRERTAFALFLYTGQRRSDVVRMAWTDIADEAIKVTQQKTGAKLKIRLHPELREILHYWPRVHIAILTNQERLAADAINMLAEQKTFKNSQT